MDKTPGYVMTKAADEKTTTHPDAYMLYKVAFDAGHAEGLALGRKEADGLVNVLMLIVFQASASIFTTEEECDMSANWVLARCKAALEAYRRLTDDSQEEGEK